MGNRCRIVAPDADLAERGRAIVQSLDDRWSRFNPASEVCALNRNAGRVTLVSAETYRLVEHASRARHLTAGLFNPLQLSRLEELGYARSWNHGEQDSPDPVAEGGPACTEDIELFAHINAVRIPVGTRFDPGGIGKGLAGDIVVEQLAPLGATSMQVELGGDVRVSGLPWAGEQWQVNVEGSDGRLLCAQLSLDGGGIATSGTHRRTWQRGGRRMHHLVDPRTGWPANTDLIAASVTASSLWFAEVIAKAVVIAGSADGSALLAKHGLAAVLHRNDGDVARIRVVENASTSSILTSRELS